MKKYVKIKMEFCGIVMPSEKDKILKFKQPLMTDKIPYIIYADLESLILKIDGCRNNPEKSTTTKIGEHNICGYSMPTIWGFDHIEDKHILYRGKDCMKKFCESLREHPKSTIDFGEKNVTVNKNRIKIIYRCRCMLYLQNKILKKSL